MWRRPALVVLYLAVVVAVTYLLELWFWWDNGFTSYHHVNPLRGLSVGQIHSLLELRGVEYTTMLEKTEIVDLLQHSGSVHFGEIMKKSQNIQQILPTEINSMEEYYQQVYEESESIWLVEVIPGEGQYVGHRLLDDRTWRTLTPKMTAIGINTAVVSCQYDRRFCARQGWSLPQLVLVFPSTDPRDVSMKGRIHALKGQQSIGREHAVVASTTHLSLTTVTSWLRKEILKRITVIDNTKDLECNWLNVTEVQNKQIPHMLYISELLTPPLLIATLGLRFSTRIKLASFSVKREDKEQVSHLVKKYGVNGPPSVVFITSQGISSYGSHKGELMRPASLESYICLLQPRTNDMFLVSLVLANLLALADFFYIFDFHIRAWKFFVRTILRVIFYNVSVFLVWLGLTALMKFESVTILLESLQWSFWYLNDSWYFAQLRYHWLMIYSYPLVFWISTFVFGFLVIVYRMITKNEEIEIDEYENNWFNSIFPLDSYLLNVLFRPMASLSRPRPSQDLGLEEGMELLIERLATPDLWLHPVVPTDYLKDLPLWRYDGWGTEDDLKSESETELDSPSENENDLLESHNCCQDENCRLCELWTTVKEIYVCHRCAILKRKLERQYLRYRKNDSILHQNSTYEKLMKVCENCLRTRRLNNSEINLKSNTGKKRGKWILSPQRLIELKWTAPRHAIESRVCAICLGKYRWSAVLCGLPCGHHYHHSCITEWLLKDNHHCPTCRWPSYKCKKFVASHQHQE